MDNEKNWASYVPFWIVISLIYNCRQYYRLRQVLCNYQKLPSDSQCELFCWFLLFSQWTSCGLSRPPRNEQTRRKNECFSYVSLSIPQVCQNLKCVSVNMCVNKCEKNFHSNWKLQLYGGFLMGVDYSWYNTRFFLYVNSRQKLCSTTLFSLNSVNVCSKNMLSLSHNYIFAVCIIYLCIYRLSDWFIFMYKSIL